VALEPQAAEREFILLKSHPAHPTRILAKPRQGIRPEATVAQAATLDLSVPEPLSPVSQGVALHLDEAKAGSVNAGAEEKSRLLSERIEALRQSGLYEFVEPDYLVEAGAIPTDPRFLDGTLWGLRNQGQSGGLPGADIGAEAAWDLSTGSADVIVVVIHSGIGYTHRELAAQMWRNPGEIAGNGFDGDGDG
jgi:hypothetical protein